ncbi:fucose permease [Solibacillus sp. R5-41]|uniref:fucose permease n=1 Tax=Solibacillus sp. R5-41 TaxID=2048654 RepID=UPI000C1257DC|nr:fucose permease [Solibacillus sp. R5-41]ATP39213.1 fucose permease [Solibacillus sp. R5-41]
MTFTKKQVVISTSIVLAIIAIIVFIPALITSSKEDQAAEKLSNMYQENFIVAKSTASIFSDNFELTVQSKDSKIVYDFNVQDDKFIGNYYEENINVQINDLLKQQMNGLVMTNAQIEPLTKPSTYKDVTIESLTVRMILPEPLSEKDAATIAQTLKTEVADVSVKLETFVVEDERDYEGVSYEVIQFFQLSAITAKSFGDIAFDTQQFEF